MDRIVESYDIPGKDGQTFSVIFEDVDRDRFLQKRRWARKALEIMEWGEIEDDRMKEYLKKYVFTTNNIYINGNKY